MEILGTSFLTGAVIMRLSKREHQSLLRLLDALHPEECASLSDSVVEDTVFVRFLDRLVDVLKKETEIAESALPAALKDDLRQQVRDG